MRENSCLIFRFNEKHCFMVLTEKLNISVLLEWANSVLAKKLCFVRKICCVVLPKKTWLRDFAENFHFFAISGENKNFLFQQKKLFLRFGRKIRFIVSAEKFFFFCNLWKLIFAVLPRKLIMNAVFTHSKSTFKWNSKYEECKVYAF